MGAGRICGHGQGASSRSVRRTPSLTSATTGRTDARSGRSRSTRLARWVSSPIRRCRTGAGAISLTSTAAEDRVLADDLLAALSKEPLAGRVVSVNLDMLSGELEGDLDLSTGGYIDLHSGEVYNEILADPMMFGEDAVIDVYEDPARWLRFDRSGSRDGWQDMNAFAERQRDKGLRTRMERATEGKGAF